MIATTSGEAYREEEAYPAKFSQVLSIAATDYWGKETPESVKAQADFMFPGENIMARTSFLRLSNSTDEASGTSVATAIASGVASLILACHRLSLSKLRSDAQTWEGNERLKIHIVRGVFTKMMDNNSAKFVKPWLFFGDSGDQTSWGEARSTLDWLSKKKFRDEKRSQEVSRKVYHASRDHNALDVLILDFIRYVSVERTRVTFPLVNMYIAKFEAFLSK